ncbi:MAG: argininosuccinate lyase [Betaproteobacteria bacterium]|nr:argininosuccinate lyase [Betaproteobacteria bacterium]
MTTDSLAPSSDRPSRTSPPAHYTWAGRFSEPATELVKRYTGSVGFDHRLWRQDIRASLAHATMLEYQGIIGDSDLEDIRRGLEIVQSEIESGDFSWSLDLEDVHLNIESRLTALVGDAGKRLHTGRSRNDQVATDIRLWVRDTIDEILALLREFQLRLLALAEKEAETPMPGFTHLQVAQPITFGHHLLAYLEMTLRDAERFRDCRQRVNRLPLGAAALAGTTYPIDRKFVARELGFDDVCENSLDAVSDRDFAIEFCAAAAITMMHFSRFSEEIVFWMNPGIGFINLADRFCTGSSIMPQKKNPDVPELARGKTGRVYGDLTALLTLMKSQPLAYNKDNQEDKEPLFDAADTLTDTLRVFIEMIGGISVCPEQMRAALTRGFATATDLADYLTKKGVPFRDAHEIVGRAVKHAETRGLELTRIPLAELQCFSPLIGEDIFSAITIEGALAARRHIGGTAPHQVRAAIERAKTRLEIQRLETGSKT